MTLDGSLCVYQRHLKLRTGTIAQGKYAGPGAEDRVLGQRENREEASEEQRSNSQGGRRKTRRGWHHKGRFRKEEWVNSARGSWKT